MNAGQSIAIQGWLARLFPGGRVRSLLGDSAWQFAEMGVRMSLNLFVGAWIARHLTASGFGMLSYVAAVLTFVFPLVKLGIDAVVLREISTHPEKTGALLRAATLITGVSGMTGAMAMLLFAAFGNHDRVLALSLGIGSLALLGNPLGVYFQILKANFLMGLVARWRMGLAFAAAGAKLYFLWQGAGVMAFVGCVVAEEITSNVICYVLCKKRSLLNMKAEASDWKSQIGPLLSGGFPLMLSFLLISIYSRLDVLMIEHLKGMRATGIYSAAYKISELWNCIPGILVGTFLPHFAKLRAENPTRFLRTMRRFSATFFWGAVCVIGFTWFAAPLLIKVLFGPDFLAAIPALRFHVLCFPGVCLGGLLSHWYIIENKSVLLVIASGAGLVVNALLNWIWIPAYGAAGAAAATAVSATVSVCVPPVCFPACRGMARTALSGIFLRL